MKTQELTSIVSDVNRLVEAYGIDEVVYTLDFISRFPNTVKKYRFVNSSKDAPDFYLTEKEFQRIESTSPRVNKIQAIKTFREITFCSLKEAKDAIETYYNTNFYKG